MREEVNTLEDLLKVLNKKKLRCWDLLIQHRIMDINNKQNYFNGVHDTYREVIAIVERLILINKE